MRILKLFKFKPKKSKVIHLDITLQEFKLSEDTRIHHCGKPYVEIHKEVIKHNPWLGVKEKSEELTNDFEYNTVYLKKKDNNVITPEGSVSFKTAEELDEFIKNPEKFEKYGEEPIKIEVVDTITSPPTPSNVHLFKEDLSVLEKENSFKKNKTNLFKTFINKLRKK